MSPRRRDVLRAGGGLAALLTGLAGCTEQLSDAPGIGGGGPDTPAYASLLFDPAAVVDVETRSFVSVDAEAYADQKAALPEQFQRSVEETTGDVDGAQPADADRIGAVLGTARGAAEEFGDERSVYSGLATGSFDAEALTTQADENERLTERGDYEGFTLYGGVSEFDPTRTTAVGIAADAIVAATVDVAEPEGEAGGSDERTTTPEGAATALDAVKTHIDTFSGSGSPLADGDAAATVLADAGDQPFVAGTLTDGATLRQLYFGDGDGGTREPDDELGTALLDLTQELTALAGTATAPESTSGEVVVRAYYGTEDVVDTRAETLRSAIETAKSRSEDVTPPETEVTTDGSAVVLTITGDPQRLAEEFGFGDSGGAGDSRSREVPTVSFSFDFEAEGSLTITHDGGDTVQADQLRIVGEDGSPDELWSASGGEVTAGVSTTVQADSSDTVRVVWRAADGESSATLAKWVGPDA
jgi:hypothetical protein